MDLVKQTNSSQKLIQKGSASKKQISGSQCLQSFKQGKPVGTNQSRYLDAQQQKLTASKIQTNAFKWLFNLPI